MRYCFSLFIYQKKIKLAIGLDWFLPLQKCKGFFMQKESPAEPPAGLINQT
jgi:hypothetical protein